MISDALTILVPTYRNDAKARRVLAGLAALVAGSEGRMRLIVGDNSQNPQKHEFLWRLAEWSPGLIDIHCRPQRISGQMNLLDLFGKSASGILMFHADDDYISDDYMVRAHEILQQDPGVSAAYTSYIVSKGGSILTVPQTAPQLDQASPVERLIENHNCWGGYNLLFYSVFRKRSLEGTVAFLNACPIEAPFHDWWFSYAMVCGGSVRNAAVGQILYAAEGTHEMGGNDSVAHYAALGLPPIVSYLQLLFTAAEGACFFLGRYSPLSDAGGRQACAQFMFETNIRIAIARLRQSDLPALGIEGEVLQQLTTVVLNNDWLTLESTIDFLHLVLARTRVDLADRYRDFLTDALKIPA
ncbi:hypothetical protein ACSFA7_24380 [Variovorax sp. LT1R20]|uniref:hypothetical protein n=1 Tax=Variovorax sp. LT1R20 TaxID=3443729 RepID=UPI003F48C132